MTINVFGGLTEKEQLEFLQKEGVYIGKRTKDKFAAILFQLDKFYVEVFYTEYRTRVDSIVAHDSTDILNNYISQVRVSILETLKTNK